LTGNLTEGGAEIVGSVTTPGSGDAAGGSSAGRGEQGSGIGNGSGSGSGSRVGGGEGPLSSSLPACPPTFPTCRAEVFITNADPAAGELVYAPITLSDIAGFPAVVGLSVAEPDGWAVTRLPVNFYSTAVSHVVDGVLLGTPASVRFTPRAWTWDYGDGRISTVREAGASWAALALPEFSATSTSHVFSTRGDFRVQLTVDFIAEYRFAGSNWVPIAGVLPLRGEPLQVTASAAKTVLVGGDCGSRQQAPGC
jgi:hypothetical protein